MKIGSYHFNRLEFAGSLGDLGTLIPLSIGMIIFNGLNLTTVFIIVGLFYIAAGLYFKLPIPVQPLKVVAAIAIAFPAKITVSVIAAAALLFGVILLFLAWTGIINWVAKYFTKPIVRGIQLGLGLILMTKGIEFIKDPNLFLQKNMYFYSFVGIPVNIIVGVFGVIVVLLLLASKRFPAALVIVTAGIIIGVSYGALSTVALKLGPEPLRFAFPSFPDFWSALFLLVIPQIPLTLGNAIIGTTDTAKNLFGEGDITIRATNRGFATSMGLVNIVVGFFSGMPVCHGAGGLAAHYRFGARTGGSNIMIGIIFMIIALLFGKIGVGILSTIPNAVLGILLLFAGLELALLIRDISERKDLFVSLIIAGISLATKNMGIAFASGILVDWVIRKRMIDV